MKHLLSSTYFPFGSQYYRAPSPHHEDWDKDLKNMADLGFNMVKYWVQWRWNNPTEGEYYFDDIDELMNLAHKHGLKVMLNTIFDVAPAWIYKKFPDASMITLSGRKIGPQTQPHRQIGGLGYCFNHDGVMEYFFDFLKTTVERYNSHPALEIWNVGSEPELTSSMAEMRDYANDINKMGDMLCFCDNCKTKFKDFLREKYIKIEALNERWNRNYVSFDDVELPLTRNNINDIIDWRMFFVRTLGNNVSKRFKVAASANKAGKPLMCHHVFIQGFPVTSTASDPWNVGRFGDLHGFTQMDDPNMIDILRSCAKDKPVISAEMLMLPGYTLDMPKNIGSDDIKRFIFSGIAGNQKGFIFWQYRPEILGREAPTWGLTAIDGSSTDWLKSFAEIGAVLQKNAEFYLNAKPASAEIAMLYSPENQIFSWASTGKENTATDSILGIHKALYELSYNIDFLHPTEFRGNTLNKYKVFIIPFPYLINEKIAVELETFVAEGGLLISEAYTAGWNLEHGYHSKIIPGYGLHKVFKARQGAVHPVNPEENTCLQIEGSGISVKCSVIREELMPEGAEVIGRYSDGKPAAVASDYGRGKAVLLGSYVGLGYQKTGIIDNAQVFDLLIAEYSELKRPYIESGKRVRIDILNDADRQLLIIQNKENEHVKAKVSINGQLKSEFVCQFKGELLKVAHIDKTSEFIVDLYPNEVKVYLA